MSLLACEAVGGLEDGGDTLEVVAHKVEELEELESMRNSSLVTSDSPSHQSSRLHQRDVRLFLIVFTLEFPIIVVLVRLCSQTLPFSRLQAVLAYPQ